MCLIHDFRNDPSVYNKGHLYSNLVNTRTQLGTFSANQIGLITTQLLEFFAASTVSTR